jgi:uncharacterized membrane protein YoaK (UPF0700 family)
MSVTLYEPPKITSIRHVPSWLLLAFAAGNVNGGAYLACQRYVTHVTGIATEIGLDVAQLTLLLEYSVVLLFFIAGAMSSVLALQGRYHRGKKPLYALPLVIVSLLLSLTALAGDHDLFGPFGAAVERPADFAFLSALAFSMGLQNAAVASSTGMAVRTTHMTGPTTDLGVHLATSFYITGEAKKSSLRGAALRGGKLLAFIMGATAMTPLVRSHKYLAFMMPAAIILVAAALSFVPSDKRLARVLSQPAP